VVVNGDTKFEPNEDFIVKLTSATNATITDFEGTGTISNDDGQPSISIDDVKVVEGNGGTTNAVFTVSLTNTSDQKVSVDYQTVDGSATVANNDYQPTGGTLSIPPKTSTATITVVVNGDTKNEGNEDFSVVLSGAVNATIQDNQGTGTISNDDTQPVITITDVKVIEGNIGTVQAVFSVLLSNTTDQKVSIIYSTADGSATTADNDYVPASGTLSIPPKTSFGEIHVLVNGDNTFEPGENFFVNLSAAANATIGDPQGVGTISNDDPAPAFPVRNTDTNTGYTTIQAAINDPNTLNGHHIVVDPGTYTENVSVTKSLTIRGAQTGVNACGRSATESIILAANPGISAVQVSAIDVVIDGFTIDQNNGLGNSPVSSGGAVATATVVTNRLNLLNNRITNFRTQAIILNRGCPDGVINGNELKSAVMTGNGSLLQTNAPQSYNGIQVTNNCFRNSTGNGLTFDGGRNVGTGANPPTISGNTFDGNSVGANIGRGAMENAVISNNVFKNSAFDGLQGGPKNSTITGNTFDRNKRWGLALTSFGATTGSPFSAGNPAGAINNQVTLNNFTANDSAGYFITTSMLAGQAKTNNANRNNFVGNRPVDPGPNPRILIGAVYRGTETFFVGCNWWNSAAGPDYPPVHPNAGADGIQSGSSFVVWTPWLGAPAPGGTCDQCPTITLSPPTLSNADVNQPYGPVNITASGGSAPYTFAVTSGSLPPGVTLTASGVLSGTPTASGSFNFTVTATDAGGTCTGSQSYKLDVHPSATISIGDVKVTEGNSGTTPAVFSISLSNPVAHSVTVHWATADGTPTQVITPSSAYFPPDAPGDPAGNQVNGVPGDGAPGYPTGSIAHNGGTGLFKSEAYITPESLFGREITLGEIASIKYWTKKGTTHTADIYDWFLVTYTKRYAGQIGSSFYGVRLATEPYYSENLADPANTWNQWTSVGGNNWLRFYESTYGYFGSYSDPHYSTFVAGTSLAGSRGPGVPYASQPVLFFSPQTASGFPAGFTGQIDGMRIELTNGAVADLNFEANSDDATVANNDYVAASGDVTFAPKTTKQTITVQVNGDTKVEPNETFTVALSAASGASTLDAVGVGTISNDDTTLPTIAIGDVKVVEGDAGTTAASFSVSLSEPSGFPVTVHWATADGSATVANGDYVAASGDLTFAPKETKKTLTVAVNGDTKNEPNEDFVVNLSNLVGATFGDNQATGTISNDDGTISQISIGDASGLEDGGPLTFSISLDVASGFPITVNYQTVDGSATVANGDYVPGGGTVTFGPKQTKQTITVQVNADTKNEPNETFTVVLSGNTGPSSILDGSGTGTIVNDDGTISQISIGDASGLENGGPLTFSISLDVPSGFPISVDYQTNDGSATTANNDYVPASGTVTFGPKDTKKTVVVQLVADCGVEPDELFTVTLSNNTGPSTIADGSGTGTILNDDVAVSPVSGLTAVQQTTGNDGDGTTKIKLTWSGGGGATSIEVWRAGFGSYPEYDDAGGSAPATPGSYPPPSPWVLTTVTASGQSDETTARDFYYFVAYAKDACGGATTVSNQTGGTLNYHLGDWHNGITNCQGNNVVNTSDLSFLGAHYGITLSHSSDPFSCLDVGPTTTATTAGRPTTDDRVQFEDLVIMSINYLSVSLAPGTLPEVAKAASDQVRLSVPALPAVGQTFTVGVDMMGTGEIQALSVLLNFDRNIVEQVSVAEGELLKRQASPGTALSSEPGDVDVAVMGTANGGLAGTGRVAEVTFRVKAAGDAGISVQHLDARNSENQPVSLAVTKTVTMPVGKTALGSAFPNPFQQTTAIQLALETGGMVKLGVFDVQGRQVRNLINGYQVAGQRMVSWNGRNDAGMQLAAGMYVIKLETSGVVTSRRVAVVK
jgi:hypothetical protein